jgi:hypothetical protein
LMRREREVDGSEGSYRYEYFIKSLFDIAVEPSLVGNQSVRPTVWSSVN